MTSQLLIRIYSRTGQEGKSRRTKSVSFASAKEAATVAAAASALWRYSVNTCENGGMDGGISAK